MFEETLNSFKIANNRYVFYDVFVHKKGYICAVAPMYLKWLKEFNIKHENIICKIHGETLSPKVIYDPHMHTVILKYYPSFTIDESLDAIFSVETYDFACTLKRSRVQSKFCVASTTLKNCSEFIETWIKYHMYIGIEHFIIYDNDSNDTDKLKEILKKYPTTYVYYPFPYKIVGNSGISGQTCAQNISLLKYSHRFFVLTDVDEYIHSTSSSLLEQLNKININKNSGILMQCQWFGCSHEVEYTGENFLEKLILKKDTPNRHGRGGGPKGIVCPDAVDMYTVHRVTIGKPMVNINHELLRFNHYYTLMQKAYNRKRSMFRSLICKCDVFDKIEDTDVRDVYQKIVKNKPKWCFISIPKNASQSVFKMFGYKLKDKSKTTDIGIMDNHARASVVKSRYYDYDSRFVFCFVRNPWERLVSWFDYHKKLLPRHEAYKGNFKEWTIRGCPHHWKIQNGTNWTNGLNPLKQWQFIYESDKQIVPHVYKMENFDEHIMNVCNTLNIQIESISHKNKATKGDWINRYDQESLNAVQHIVERDAMLFGYSFDS